MGGNRGSSRCSVAASAILNRTISRLTMEGQLSMSASRQHDDEPLRTSSSKRFTTTEKVNAVLRLLKGEPLAKLSLELGVAAHRLERWQNDFVTGGSAALSKRKS